MENHWLVLFLLFSVRLALAQTDVTDENLTSRITSEPDSSYKSTEQATTLANTPSTEKSSEEEKPSASDLLFRAPSSIKTANFGQQRGKNPENGYAPPWASSSPPTPEEVITTFPPPTTTEAAVRFQPVQQFQPVQHQFQQQYKPVEQAKPVEQSKPLQRFQHRPRPVAHKPQHFQQREPQVQQVQREPQIQQVQREPQIQQVQREPQIQQVQREPQIQQVQREPQVQQVQREPQIQQVQREPQVQEIQQVQREPQIHQVQKEPQFQQVHQVQKEPQFHQVQQVQREPQVQQVQREPQIQQVQREPQVQEIQQVNREPQVQQVQREPQIQQVHQTQQRFRPVEQTHQSHIKQYKSASVKTAPAAAQAVHQEEPPADDQEEPAVAAAEFHPEEPEVAPPPQEESNEVERTKTPTYANLLSEEERLKKADASLEDFLGGVLHNLSARMQSGMEEVGGEVLDPVRLDDLQLQPLVAGEAFDVRMRRIAVSGLSDFRVTQLESQLNESRVKVGLRYPRLAADCQFSANGSLYEIFKVTGKGNATVVFEEVHARTVLYLSREDGTLRVTSADQPYVDFKSAQILFRDADAPEGSEPVKAESVATQLGPLYFWVLTANAVDKVDYPLALYFNKALKDFPLADYVENHVFRQRHLRIHSPIPYAYVSSEQVQPSH